MKPLVPGQRVLQFPHDDLGNPIRPGTEGVVRSYDQAKSSVVIDWDNGIQQTLPNTAPFITLTSTWTPAAGTGLSWEATLRAVRAAGADAGTTAADRWCRDTIGDRAGGNVTSRAHAILHAIDNGDPELIDGLPTYDSGSASGFVEPPCDTDLTAMMARPGTGPAVSVSTDDWAHAVCTYRDGFDTALLEHIARQCQTVISPTGDGRDLSHLHPDTISVGRAGVFAGDWTYQDDGPGRYRIAYVGTLIDRWNGWAVFSCTRFVAEAIVADHEQQRQRHRAVLAAGGMTGDDLDHAVDDDLCHLYFDGDVIVADQRRQYDDPHAIDRIGPNADGRYVVMGWNWTWEAVDPMTCDQVIGELPAAGTEQEFVLLKHTRGMRVPHTRWQLTGIADHPTPVAGLTATLTIDSMMVGTLRDDGTGGLRLIVEGEAPGWDTYVATSRHLGWPVTAERLLDALVTETTIDGALSRIAADDLLLIRMLDDDGRTPMIQPIPGQPDPAAALHAFGHAVGNGGSSVDPATRWEFWTGRSWRTLPGTTTASTETLPVPPRNASPEG